MKIIIAAIAGLVLLAGCVPVPVYAPAYRAPTYVYPSYGCYGCAGYYAPHRYYYH